MESADIVYVDPSNTTPSWSNIKGVRPKKLIQLISTFAYHDNDFVQSVVYTHKDYMKSEDFIHLCTQRYEGPAENSSNEERLQWEKEKSFAQSSLVVIVQKWLLSLRPVDFVNVDDSTPNNLTVLCTNFINCVPEAFRTELLTILFSAKKKSTYTAESGAARKVVSNPGTTIKFEKQKKETSEHSLSAFDDPIAISSFLPEEIAKELTIIDSDILRNINPLCFSKQSWTKKTRDKLAPNINSFTEWFNYCSRWISTKIVSKDSVEARAAIIEGFITIGMTFLELRNYNGVMIILSSLHSSAISRLKQTWAAVSQKFQADFQTISTLLSPEKNFKNYRPLLKEVGVGTPCVPYLGLMLSDYVAMDESQPIYLDEGSFETNGFINVARIIAVGTKFHTLQILQTPYANLKSNEKLRSAIFSERVWDENEIFNVSKLREDSSDSNKLVMTSSGDSTTGSSHPPKPRKNSMPENRIELTGTDLISSVKTLTKRDLQVLLASGYEKTFRAGDVLVEQGARNKFIFRVVTGSLRVSRANSDEEGEAGQILSDTVFPGQITGQLSLLNNLESPVQITAIQPTEVQVFHIPTLLVIFNVDPILAATFYKTISVHLATKILTVGSEYENSSVFSSNFDCPRTHLDAEFSSRFGIDGEVPIKKYQVKRGSTNGILFITKNHVCFYGSLLGVSKQKKQHYDDISHISKVIHEGGSSSDGETSKLSSQQLVFTTHRRKNKKYSFKFYSDFCEAEQLVSALWRRNQKSKKPGWSVSPLTSTSSGTSLASLVNSPIKSYVILNTNLPTKEDWAIILKGAKKISLKKGQVIVHEGQNLRRMLVITKGECSVERLIGEDGEFVYPTPKPYSVSANSSSTDNDSTHVHSSLHALTNPLVRTRSGSLSESSNLPRPILSPPLNSHSTMHNGNGNDHNNEDLKKYRNMGGKSLNAADFAAMRVSVSLTAGSSTANPSSLRKLSISEGQDPIQIHVSSEQPESLVASNSKHSLQRRQSWVDPTTLNFSDTLADDGIRREIVGTLKEGEIFGVDSFLLECPSTGCLIAESDEVELAVLEPSIIHVICGLRVQLAAKFYTYLASSQFKKVHSKLAPSFPISPRAYSSGSGSSSGRSSLSNNYSLPVGFQPGRRRSSTRRPSMVTIPEDHSNPSLPMP
eukprot:TRINITY_DN7222_c0_g1_i1.p1 TRINITY_DN7222_c0_g1~~TRINITY_DN7222_c0_g1_i1.p1  ORF type:complete len:1155 (-),score=208.22 TRINITY_DN7222_c0_g1_i1:41-3505(-)